MGPFVPSVFFWDFNPDYLWLVAECVRHLGITAYLQQTEMLDAFRYLHCSGLKTTLSTSSVERKFAKNI